MILPTPDLNGYVVIDRSPDIADTTELASAVEALAAGGWRQALVIDGLSIHLGPTSRLRAVQVHRRHVLIGLWHGEGAFLSTVIGGHRSANELARAVLSHGWGQYIFVWRDDLGDLRILRDPSGALDCVIWRTNGVSFATSQPPEALNPVLPEGLSIDWDVLGEIARNVTLASDTLALSGLEALSPGSLAHFGDPLSQVSLWDPGRTAGAARSWDERPGALVDVVDRAVRTLVTGHNRILTEISGGLDSAIVAGSLVESGGASSSRFVNFFDDQAEGDERPFARAASDRWGVTLEEIHKPIAPLTRDQFQPLGQGVRPGLHGTDMVYDADMASLVHDSGATGLLTGQGGDAVFFQSPDPLIVADRFKREGFRGLSPGYIASVARWTRHSVWTIARHTLFPKPAPTLSGRNHRWLANVDGLAPAKTRQVQHLTNCQTFWGDCLRARSATLLHPLLTQPVIEHCLAIPTDYLALGARDRGFARVAFASRLPAAILERRDKGDLSRFYAQVIRGSVGVFRDLLLEGRLAEKGVIDPQEIDQALAEDRLIWNPATNRFLILAVLEAWARNWEARIERVRHAKVSIQPVENS